MAKQTKVQFFVNGKKQTVQAPPMARLLDVLRNSLKLTGAKEGCGEGECGACSVLIDGKAVNSCIIPVCQAQDAKITTVEGLAKNKKLNKLQKAFTEWGGAQCGICTPGMLVACEAMLKVHKKPSEEKIREAIAGNLCRCTGYTKIVLSVKKSLSGASR